MIVAHFPRLWMASRSLRQHLLSTSVTILSVAIATGLAISTFSLSRASRAAFVGGDLGFDAVVGARGSELQLVLNAIFHLETSTGNLPWSRFESLRDDPRVRLAVPLVVGDNFRGFRIVGTTPEALGEFELSRGGSPRLAPGGVWFSPDRREVVIGSAVAEATGLAVGKTLHAYHGVEYHDHDDEGRHDEEFVVVGVLAPTQTPVDRVLWIPIEGAFRLEGHHLRGGGEEYTPTPGVPIPDEHKEVSAVLLKLADHQSGFTLSNEINRGEETVATMAWPTSRSLADLFDKFGFVTRVLEVVAWLVMIVASLGILAAIYNSIHERRREFAVLRALGARRTTVVSVIVLEATLISLLGTLGGFVVYGLIQTVVATWVAERTGVALAQGRVNLEMILVPAGMALLGIVAGLLPAWRAYATDVASSLEGAP